MTQLRDPVPAATAPTAAGACSLLPFAHRATLLSQRGGRQYPASVHSWLETGAGVVARVTVREGAALRLAANRVWMSMLSTQHGFTVCSGTAQRVGETFLDLHDLEPLVQEVRRRFAPRVVTDTAVTVRSGRRPGTRLQARDVSRGGVRVAADDETFELGEHVTLDLHLDDGPVLVRGQVTRVDTGSGDAVVRFEEAPMEQRVALDHYVLTRLATATR